MSRLQSQPVTWRARVVALLLLLSYLLPFAQMAYASSSDPEAGLPACCRTHGKHKCFMLASVRLPGDGGTRPVLTSAQVSEKCPCVPASSSASGTSHLGLSSIGRVRFAAPPESLLAAARSRQRVRRPSPAHQKRGPPAFLFFA
jgi:hypothetical protein